MSVREEVIDFNSEVMEQFIHFKGPYKSDRFIKLGSDISRDPLVRTLKPDEEML